jgi:hypothetical protein
MTTQMWAVGAAAIAAFLISSVWYGALGGLLGDRKMSPWMPVLELLRSAVVAVVVAVACGRLGVDGVGGLMLVGLVAWVGFPVVLLSGSVLHEGVPWRLAALHAGDWLLKLVAIALIVGLWR